MAVMFYCRTVEKAEALAAQMQGGAQAISLDQLNSGMLISLDVLRCLHLPASDSSVPPQLNSALDQPRMSNLMPWQHHDAPAFFSVWLTLQTVGHDAFC